MAERPRTSEWTGARTPSAASYGAIFLAKIMELH